MKSLLVFLLVFLSFLANGANPSYEAFLGTNGIIIRSNPPQGKVIIDGFFLTNGLSGGGTGSVVFADLVWTNDNGVLKPVSFPTNVLLRVNAPDNGVATNFYFDSRVYRTNAASKLFAIYNGGSNALTVGPYGGIFEGRGNATPSPGVVLSGIFDTALGETNQQEVFIMSQNSAVGYNGAADLIVDTNYGALILVANKEGGTKFSRFAIQTGAGLDPQNFNTFSMQALVDGATYFLVDPNFTTLTPTNYLFSSSVRITNIHTLMSLQNSNTPVFEVDGVGDLRMIKRIPYLWPSAQGAAGTALTNNGSGGLGWWPISVGSGVSGITNLFSPTLSNATIKPLVVGVGNAAGATNSTGEIRGIEAGANVTITPNGSNYVIASTGGGGVGFADLIWTNNTDVIYPYIHSNRIHFGTAETNGARVNLEYYAPRKSLRQGVVSGTQWDLTNLGIASVAFGSNNVAGGWYASVLGGQGNLINTNNTLSVISGGENSTISSGGRNFIGGGNGHTIGALSSNAVISGGSENVIDGGITVNATIAGGTQNRVRVQGGFIGGGSGNDVRAHSATIAGGLNNVAGDDVGATDIGTSIGGGGGNSTFGAYSTIGGGNKNLVNADTGTNATIGGGVGNITSSINTTIGGGALNIIENLAEQATIGGGFTNYISTASSAVFATIPGGVSNRVNSAPMAWTLGSFGTNATPMSLLFSPSGTHGSNRLHVTATATTNIGLLEIREVVGRGDGSLKIWQTNQRGYTEFTTTNAVIATNRLVWSIGSNTVAANDVFVVHSSTIANGVNNIVVTNGVVSGVGSTGITNLFTPSLSNATIKPIVFGGVGNAAGMTNLTGQLYGLEQGANITLTPNGSNIVVASTAGGGGVNFADLAWTNEPAGRIHPVAFTNRVEIQRTLTIGTNSESFSGAPGTNDFIFGVRDITKAEDYSPKIEFAVTSNAVHSLIASILTRDQAAWRFRHNDEGGNVAAAIIGADKPGGTIILTSTNGTTSFAVVETNIFLNSIGYVFPGSQGAAGTVLTNDGAGNLGWNTDQSSSAGSFTNLFSPTLSNATIKPLVVGIGNAAGATNTTGHIRGLEAGANVTLTANGSNIVVAASASGSSLSFSNQLWVEVNGNDSTGARNDPSKPFQSITNAISAALSNDVINVGVGRWTNFVPGIILSNNLTLRGVDPNNTVLLFTNNHNSHGPGLKPLTNTVIENLALEVAHHVVGTVCAPIGFHESFTDLGGTNVVFRNVRVKGFSDNIIIVSTTNIVQMSFYDCEFKSSADVVVMHGNATNYLYFKNCKVFTSGPVSPAVAVRMLNMSAGLVHYDTSTLIATNDSAETWDAINLLGGRARLENCYLSAMTNSGSANLVRTVGAGRVEFAGMLQLTNNMLGNVVMEPPFVSGVEAGANITLTTNSSSVVTIASTGGSAAGGDMAIQFNQGGSTFAGTNRLYYDRTNESLISASVVGKSSFVATNPASSLGLDIRANVITTTGGDLNLGAGSHEWKIESTDGSFYPDSTGKHLGTTSQRIGTVTAAAANLLSGTQLPAMVATSTVGQATNLAQWIGTNGATGLAISSNGLYNISTPLPLANAVAFRTNQIDLKLNQLQAFSASIKTNLVLQLTNCNDGVTHTLTGFGAGRLGGGVTNAWQLLCTAPAGTTIYWPPGTTNGNYDVLVNSNQVVTLTFQQLFNTNILASYLVRESSGAN